MFQKKLKKMEKKCQKNKILYWIILFYVIYITNDIIVFQLTYDSNFIIAIYYILCSICFLKEYGKRFINIKKIYKKI